MNDLWANALEITLLAITAISTLATAIIASRAERRSRARPQPVMWTGFTVDGTRPPKHGVWIHIHNHSNYVVNVLSVTPPGPGKNAIALKDTVFDIEREQGTFSWTGDALKTNHIVSPGKAGPVKLTCYVDPSVNAVEGAFSVEWCFTDQPKNITTTLAWISAPNNRFE
ncbi:MAG: hypothetical protein AAFU34_15655 [Pseudomonadota bacterium]